MKANSSLRDEDLIQLLQELKSIEGEYPPDLLAARRAAFLGQVVQGVRLEEEQSPQTEKIIGLMKSLGAGQGAYPPELLAARRAAFTRQVGSMRRVVLWNGFRSAIQTRLSRFGSEIRMPAGERLRTSLVIAGLVLAAYVGFLGYGSRTQSLNSYSRGGGTIHSVSKPVTTSIPGTEVSCKPGYLPPLCLVAEADKNQALTFQGNGYARPAVAKDTNPGYAGIHRAENINDGFYGPGASWMSNSANSWIKIDLGQATTINTVTFGRDRLGKFNDRSPGQFEIAVAMSDDVYADGDNGNDEIEYTPVFRSEQAGFEGTISSAETVMAQFDPVMARYIKITFENEGTAIDEVEVFMLETPVANNPTKKPEENVPANTSTPLPTNTVVPSVTALPTDTPTSTPTSTPLPTDTPTSTPTSTPLPTDTTTPFPTSTLPPTDTSTPTLSIAAFMDGLPGFNGRSSGLRTIPTHHSFRGND